MFIQGWEPQQHSFLLPLCYGLSEFSVWGPAAKAIVSLSFIKLLPKPTLDQILHLVLEIES